MSIFYHSLPLCSQLTHLKHVLPVPQTLTQTPQPVLGPLLFSFKSNQNKMFPLHRDAKASAYWTSFTIYTRYWEEYESLPPIPNYPIMLQSLFSESLNKSLRQEGAVTQRIDELNYLSLS